jgi:hypothetical protein
MEVALRKAHNRLKLILNGAVLLKAAGFHKGILTSVNT